MGDIAQTFPNEYKKMDNCYAVKSDGKAKEVSVCRTRRSVESIVGEESAFNGKKRRQVEGEKGG